MIFLSWSSPFNDVSCLRGWLEQEGFDDSLPKDKYLHRDRMEFRQNLKEILGSTCWKSGSFPLSLETVFPVLCGFDHPLAGKNHHALADAQQLALLTLLFVDLCRPVNQRVMWNGNGVNSGPGKRQRTLEQFELPKAKKPKS